MEIAHFDREQVWAIKVQATKNNAVIGQRSRSVTHNGAEKNLKRKVLKVKI